MKIKNAKELAGTKARALALRIAEAGLQAIDTGTVMHGLLRREGDAFEVGGEHFDAGKISRIFVVGVGKCAADAGKVFEEVLGDRLTAGIALDVRKPEGLKKLRGFEGTHPFPSERNVEASAAIVELLTGLQKNDLVIFLISGGGSTLLCLPEGGTWKEEEKIVHALMAKGVTIQELNTVRKHLSKVRGGNLAKCIYPARGISLILSDIPGNAMEFIASGPTMKDLTTRAYAEEILRRYDILREAEIDRCELSETPKDDKYFENIHNILALSNETALHAMQAEAKSLGFDAEIRTSHFTGEAAAVGRRFADYLHDAKPGSALIFGGETTVKSGGEGRGGRNLELALSALEELRGDELLMTIASDGRDNGPFGGAIADAVTKKAAAREGLSAKDALLRHDTYPFFEKIGSYLIMEHTGSNVSDLVVALKYPNKL